MMIDIVSFTGNSGLTDYSVSLAREWAKVASVRLVTAHSVSDDYLKFGFSVKKIFRRSRHLIFDYPRVFFLFIFATTPRVLVFQSWLKLPLIDALLVLLCRARGHRCIGVVHDTLPHHPHRLSGLFLRIYYSSFCGLIAHSEVSQRDLRSMGVRLPINVVPHGVYDIFLTKPKSAREARDVLTLPQDRAIVLYFGHIDSRKGCLEFLEAASMMRDDQRFFFLMAGRNDLHGEDASLLEKYRSCSNLRIDDRHIPFEDVQLYFQASDVVALIYREGTTSGVLKLAVCFGNYVLATPVGDLNDAIHRNLALPVSMDLGIAAGFQAALDRWASLSCEIDERRGILDEERGRTSWSKVLNGYQDLLSVV
jgi:glycosyltransferase involved in cell wall biosynthesis